MADKMSKAPIFFAVAQVTFNEIRGMEKYVDEIQEYMRSQKFVDFSQNEQKAFQINVASPEPVTHQSGITRWQFVNFEKTTGYVLTSNALYFQTTAYETSTELRHALFQGVKKIHEVVGLDYVQAIGIRTLDAIVPAKGEELTLYLKQNLHGFGDTLSGTLRHSMMETVMSKPDGMLVARVTILGPETPGIGVPFDLYPIHLKLADRFQAVKGTHAVLDNDRTQLKRFRFDLDQIQERFIQMKEDVTEAFNSAITDTARNIWR